MFVTPAVAGTTVYAGSCAGVYYAFDLETGAVRWSYDFKPTVGHATFHGDPLLTDDLLVTGTEALDPPRVYAFDPSTGAVLWQRGGRHALTRSDVVGAGKLVIGRNETGELVALDAGSGELRWVAGHEGRRYRPDVAESPAIVGSAFGALEAFLPGLLALGGDTARAARLQESVDRMWRLHGIEPEQLDYSTMEVASPGYPLRPEAIESAYYLFRLTGDQRWRDMGRRMLDAVIENTRVEHGFAHVADVRTMELDDAMESFFLAETLKYAWLLAAPASTLELDAVVFNTEAHPLRRLDR